MSLQGHVKQMVSMKFSNNCFQLASGSDDNTVKIWDIRRKGCIYTLPAHQKTISDICFDKNDSKFMLTCSYDSTIKLWNVRDWSIVKIFSSAGEGKLTSVSVSNDNKYLITTSLDRTIKLWELKTGQEVEIEGNNDKIDIINDMQENKMEII